MSLGPVHTGSAGPGTTSTVTGLDGPSRARSTEAATAPSRRATMTSPRGRPPSVTRPSPASSVSRAVSRTWAPAPATAGSRPRGSRARRSSRSSRTSSANSGRVMERSIARHPGAGPRRAAAPGCRRAPGRPGRRSCRAARRPPRRPSAGCGGCPGRPGSPAAAGRAPAARRVAGFGVSVMRAPSPGPRSRSAAIRASSGASTLSRSSGSVLLARRLNHDAVGQLDRQPVQLVDGDAVLRRRRTCAPRPCAAGASATVELISPDAA